MQQRGGLGVDVKSRAENKRWGPVWNCMHSRDTAEDISATREGDRAENGPMISVEQVFALDYASP